MSSFPSLTKSSREELLTLLAKDAYRLGEFTLSSGRKSQHYVNCKPVSLSGRGLLLLSTFLLEKVEFDSVAVAGMTLGADPLVSAVAIAAQQNDRSLDALIVRKEAKGYGTADWVEGPLPEQGKRITVLEDVVTTGGSSLKVVKLLREASYIVDRVVTIVDREEGGNDAMTKEGLELKSLFSLKEVAEKALELFT